MAVGAGSDGLRGLITTRAAKPGDVLLEVPMACCLSDFGAGEAAVEPPSWTSGMEWTVQLACSVLAQRAANSPLLADWPEAPPVPLLCEADELSLACDEALASRVREQRLWALGQCALALGAAEAAADTASATLWPRRGRFWRHSLSCKVARCFSRSHGPLGCATFWCLAST